EIFITSTGPLDWMVTWAWASGRQFALTDAAERTMSNEVFLTVASAPLAKLTPTTVPAVSIVAAPKTEARLDRWYVNSKSSSPRHPGTGVVAGYVRVSRFGSPPRHPPVGARS